MSNSSPGIPEVKITVVLLTPLTKLFFLTLIVAYNN